MAEQSFLVGWVVGAHSDYLNEWNVFVPQLRSACDASGIHNLADLVDGDADGDSDGYEMGSLDERVFYNA